MLTRRKFFISSTCVAGTSFLFGSILSTSKILSFNKATNSQKDLNTLYLKYSFSENLEASRFFELAQTWHNVDYAKKIKARFQTSGLLLNETNHFTSKSYEVQLKFINHQALQSFISEYNSNDPRDFNKVAGHNIHLFSKLIHT